MCRISVHPCDKESNGGCQDICNKEEGDDYHCSCNPPGDYELVDGKTCKKSKLISNNAEPMV